LDSREQGTAIKLEVEEVEEVEEEHLVVVVVVDGLAGVVVVEATALQLLALVM
jgi:hypothetical protein